MMENPVEIEDLSERDRRLYGNPDGPAFDQLVQESQQLGLRQDEVFVSVSSAVPKRQIER